MLTLPGLRTLFNARAGTIILPTEQAFDDFMDLNGMDVVMYVHARHHAGYRL